MDRIGIQSVASAGFPRRAKNLFDAMDLEIPFAVDGGHVVFLQKNDVSGMIDKCAGVAGNEVLGGLIFPNQLQTGVRLQSSPGQIRFAG